MSIKAKPSFSLKDQLFNPDSVALLSKALAAARPGFRRKAFEREVLEPFPALELKERIAWVVTILARHLPEDYPEALDVLLRALPAPLDPSRTDDDFGLYIWVVPGEYAARFGCGREHLDASLGFLRETTKRFTAESAIRPFLRDFPTETLRFVVDCAGDENYHVRRLASEGIRPLLPWAERVVLPSAEIIAVLDRLHADPTRYVTRSVANTLNDLSKSDPDLTIDTLERWHRQQRQNQAELDWMTRHALRTLTRRDHPRALELLGYPLRPRVKVRDLSVDERVRVGERLDCRFVLESRADQNLLISMRIHFLKANGQHAAKDFIIRKAAFRQGETASLKKSQSFRPMTTRALYPGRHRLEIVVNGQIKASSDFELVS